MKRLVTAFLALVLLLSSCASSNVETTSSPETAEPTDTTNVLEETEFTDTAEEPIVTDAPEETEEVKVDRVDYKITVKDDVFVINNDGTNDLSDKNFGKEPDIQIKDTKISLIRYSYLKFDISSLADDKDFTAIELDLMLKSKQSTAGDPENAVVEIYSVSPDGWDENSVTFNNRPQYVDLITLRDDVKGAGDVFSFPVTSYVKQALENGKTEVAFYVADASAVPLHIKFESKESGKQAPALSVYYGTKVDNKEYYGKMWGPRKQELSQNGVDNIVGLRQNELLRLVAVEDSYTEAGISENKNFGTSTFIDVKAPGSNIGGTVFNEYYRVGFLKFDLSELGETEFERVSLELNCKLVEKGDIAVLLNIYGCYPYDWTEDSLTYKNIPEKEEPVVSDYVKEKGIVRFDVTDYVKKCLARGDKQISFYLDGDTSTTRRLQFDSKEANGKPPALVFDDETTGKGFATVLVYNGPNPWDNAMEMVSDWLARWAKIKNTDNGDFYLVERNDADYTLVVDATDNTSTKGASTVYNQYPTRLVSTLKGYTASTAETEKYDIYGGLMDESMKQEATGFFYTKKIGDRWWNIDPLGYPLFRTSVVTISKGNSKQQAIVNAKYGTTEKWASETTKRLRELGFNSAGGWSSISSLHNVEAPLSQTYVISVLRGYCQNYGLDVTTGGNTALLNDIMPVFDPAFVSEAENIIKPIVQPYAISPNIYGWMTDNELPSSDRMLDSALTLNTKDSRFSYTYAVAWTFMYLKTGKIDVSVADVTNELRREYRAMVYDRYFKVVTEVLDRYVPYHQYMGCRFLQGCYKDEYVMRVAGYWCDVITYNYYNAWDADYQMISNQVKWAGKPFVVTEFYAKGMDVWEKDNRMTNESGAGWTVRNQDARGKFYQNFALSLLESKGCVGFDWFLYWDNDPENLTADLSNRNSNKGIIDNNGNEYTELTKYMEELNNQKYSLIKFLDER